jgi:hypothetical protein
MTTILILLTLAAIAAAGRNLPSMLFAPILSIIQYFGSLIEGFRENLKRYILTPEPPGLIRYILSALFTLGSITWSLMDALLTEVSLKIIVSEKTLQLFKTGIQPVDYFISNYLYSCIALVLVLMLTLLFHFAFSYIANRYPHLIEQMTFISVVVAALGMLIIMALMRYYSSQWFSEVNRAIANHNYVLPNNLTSKTGMLSMMFLVWGILCAGICAHLGFNQFLKQTAQILTGIVFVPISLLLFFLVLLSKLVEGVKAIIGIPVAIVSSAVDLIKESVRKRQPDYRIISMIVIFILSIFLSGCTLPVNKPKLIVAVIDQSYSFKQEQDNTITKVNNLIDFLGPEDHFYCLFINGKSYSDKQLLYILPRQDEADIYNLLDDYKSRDDVKKSISDILAGPCSNNSDILGALHRAQAIYKSRREGYDKYLFLFSDLSDNINRQTPAPELDSVRVITLFSNSDKKNHLSAKSQTEAWEKVFTDSRASEVLILGHDISMSFDIKQYLERGI